MTNQVKQPKRESVQIREFRKAAPALGADESDERLDAALEENRRRAACQGFKVAERSLGDLLYRRVRQQTLEIR